MPQLNIETYVSQYFWLIVILFGFYYFNVTVFIPKLSSILKLRNSLESSETGVQASETSTAINFLGSVKIQEIPVNHIKTHFANGVKAWVQSTKK